MIFNIIGKELVGFLRAKQAEKYGSVIAKYIHKVEETELMLKEAVDVNMKLLKKIAELQEEINKLKGEK